MTEQIAFISLTALTLLPALFVVRSRNIVHAGYWLLPCFVGVAGLYATLEAHFFFVVQLLVYAGAILVLILFALMLTRDVMNPAVRQSNRLGLWAGLVCAAIAIGASAILTRHPWAFTNDRPAASEGQIRALGESLIGLYAVPFEVASLLLLAALIGSVILAKSDVEDVPDTPLLPTLEEEVLERPHGPESNGLEHLDPESLSVTAGH
jgi:NADH-quinone oxidoreductase subunit J